jgi:hypothetical protein
MWIFTIAPEWVIHLIFSVGLLGVIAGFVLGFIPFINRYLLPIKIISLIVFAFGLYLEGGLADNKEWQLKIKEVEAQVAKAEAEAAKANTELQAALTNKTDVIKQKGETIVKYVDRYRDREVLKTIEGPERVRVEEVIKYVETCPVPKELIDIHNQAAGMNKGDKK